jgi:cysteine synthase A
MKTLTSQKVKQLNAFYADQFGSKDVVLDYQPMGLEIANQILGEVTVLCAAVGTGGALMGTLDGLNNAKEFPKVVALEPTQSPY